MMNSTVPNIVIAGTGACLPAHKVSNKELLTRISGFDHEAARTAFLKRSNDQGTDVIDYTKLAREELFDLWVQKVCGIQERPFIQPGEFAEGLVCEDMARIASQRALAAAGLEAAAIDHVVFSTYSSNRMMPASAPTLVNMLKLRQGPTGVSARTLNGACSGFLDAFIDATLYLQSGQARHVLVVAAENMSDKMDYTDPTSCIIFSDGAGACVLSAQQSSDAAARGVLGFASAIDYSEQINMLRTGPISFKKGPLVQRNAVLAMYNIGQQALARSHLTYDDLGYVIPHQANARITAALAKKLSAVANLRLLDTIAFTGNLSSATIPVTLDKLLRGELKTVPYCAGTRALLTSVGGGYTYSAAVVTL